MSSELKPVYYLYGSEEYLVGEELERIKKAALGTGGFEDMNHSVFDSRGLDPGEVLGVANTMPAFSERRLVVVRGAESLKAADLNAFLDYVEDPSPTTCLVFVSSNAKAGNSKFIKLLDKKGYLVAKNRMREKDLPGWVKREAKKAGKTISDRAAWRLVSTAGTALRDLSGELEKLVTYVGDKPSIDEQDIAEAGTDCREETIFNLSDAIGRRDLAGAMKIFRKVSTEEPLKILGAVARQVRVLLELKSLMSTGRKADLASKVGVPPYFLKKYVAMSGRFTEEELKGAVRKLKEADTDLKTGRIPRPLVLPKLITELCSPGAKGDKAAGRAV